MSMLSHELWRGRSLEEVKANVFGDRLMHRPEENQCSNSGQAFAIAGAKNVLTM
jgi:hypothetical protein